MNLTFNQKQENLRRISQLQEENLSKRAGTSPFSHGIGHFWKMGGLAFAFFAASLVGGISWADDSSKDNSAAVSSVVSKDSNAATSSEIAKDSLNVEASSKENSSQENDKNPQNGKIETCPASSLACVLNIPECSVFAKAVRESGLEDVLASAPKCTIFAPTNAAFEQWSPDQLDSLFQCPPAMMAIVLNHVCPQSLSPEDLMKLQQIATACNAEDCERLCGKEKTERCCDFCPAMKKHHEKPRYHCFKDGKVCFGMGKLSRAVSKYPSDMVQCNNGYVYTVDQVQIPYGLLVYEALTEIPDEVVVVGEVTEVEAPNASNGSISTNPTPASADQTSARENLTGTNQADATPAPENSTSEKLEKPQNFEQKKTE